MLSDSFYNAPNDKILKLLLQRGVRAYTYVLNSTLDGLKNIQGNPQNILKNGEIYC